MTYTLTTSPQQEALLSWITKQYNLEHETQLTNIDYINMRFPQLLGPYASAYHEALSDSVAKALDQADPPTQAKVLSLLGVQP